MNPQKIKEEKPTNILVVTCENVRGLRVTTVISKDNNVYVSACMGLFLLAKKKLNSKLCSTVKF